jgi:hypothetical protein
MGLLTALRIRKPYIVAVYGVPNFPRERFRFLNEARAYADYIAETTMGAVCVIRRISDDEAIYSADWSDTGRPPRPPPGGDGSSGVREPRRPIPGSSAGAVELDLPD